MFKSALCEMATALLLIFLIHRLLKAVFNITTYANIYISLKGNDICAHFTMLSDTYTRN
ncbi:hypothetical protein ABID99_004935 [Mucilaginibacter sp. OAE612]